MPGDAASATTDHAAERVVRDRTGHRSCRPDPCVARVIGRAHLGAVRRQSREPRSGGFGSQGHPGLPRRGHDLRAEAHQQASRELRGTGAPPTCDHPGRTAPADSRRPTTGRPDAPGVRSRPVGRRCREVGGRSQRDRERRRHLARKRRLPPGPSLVAIGSRVGPPGRRVSRVAGVHRTAIPGSGSRVGRLGTSTDPAAARGRGPRRCAGGGPGR